MIVLLKQFDDHRWIVNRPDGRNILMNERAIGLLKILSGSSSSGGIRMSDDFFFANFAKLRIHMNRSLYCHLPDKV